jgi:crotonobetainyl-CoA:carnitine CoA-transferase CaiB-like acyl-CoA transferase
MERLERESIPCGPLQSLEAVINDPQTRSLEILCASPDHRTTTVGLPISFDGVRPPLPGNTPALGEHDAMLESMMAASANDKETKR